MRYLFAVLVLAMSPVLAGCPTSSPRTEATTVPQPSMVLAPPASPERHITAAYP